MNDLASLIFKPSDFIGYVSMKDFLILIVSNFLSYSYLVLLSLF